VSPRRKKTFESRLADWSFALLLVAISLIWLFPYLWMVLTSFKTLPEIVEAPTRLLPKSFGLEAYRLAIASMPLGKYVWNTTQMALGIAALQLALALPAGYALAKLRFRGKNLAFGLVVLTLLVPAQVRFVPIFTLFASVGWVNTMSALILPFGVSALGTFLVRQALLSLPDAFIEAARIDGASEFRIVFGLLPPLLIPTLTSFFLFSFVYHWNDYFWPLVMTTDDAVRTLPLGVALLREQGTGVRWHIVMAGNVLLSVPVLALFAVVQKKLLHAVTASTS
jgi:sn-glycerol 3-phosphate transport system permease protein